MTMTMTLFRKISLFLVLCPLFSMPALALADTLYEIELLVFEQSNQQALGEEWWPEQIAELPHATQPNFIPAKKLKKPAHATILLHTAWQQSIEPQKTSPDLIALCNQSNLSGTVHVFSNRFLHAALDLRFQKKVKITRQQPGLVGVSVHPAASGEDRMLIFKLNQSQKIKLNEVYYFDHPAFGAILIINPV